MTHPRQNGFAWLLLAVAVLAMPGCTVVAGAATVSATGKTPLDHVVSIVMGKDCSMVRREKGLSYCVEEEVSPPESYCYRTLGEVSCYDRPNPFPGVHHAVGILDSVAATMQSSHMPERIALESHAGSWSAPDGPEAETIATAQSAPLPVDPQMVVDPRELRVGTEPGGDLSASQHAQ